MTKRQKFKVWFLIALSYVFNFGTPFAAAYVYLAKDNVSKLPKGGAFFFIVGGIIAITFFVSVMKLINKMKANTFKSIFKGLVKVCIIIGIQFSLKYVTYNFIELLKVFNITIIGMVLGTLVETYVVSKYNDYVREVEILW